MGGAFQSNKLEGLGSSPVIINNAKLISSLIDSLTEALCSLKEQCEMLNPFSDDMYTRHLIKVAEELNRAG